MRYDGLPAELDKALMRNRRGPTSPAPGPHLGSTVRVAADGQGTVTSAVATPACLAPNPLLAAQSPLSVLT